MAKENGQTGPEDLPDEIKEALKTGGYAFNKEVWDQLKGQPEAFLRFIIRKGMEDRGKAPPTDARDDKESLGY